jgi:hypothetical protein
MTGGFQPGKFLALSEKIEPHSSHSHPQQFSTGSIRIIFVQDGANKYLNLSTGWAKRSFSV